MSLTDFPHWNRRRRDFLKLAGGGTVAVLAPRMPLMAAAQKPAAVGLAAAYAEHLRATKGILDIRPFHQSGTGPDWLDVVVVSAGFTADQMADFHAACEQLVKKLLSIQPWQRYRDLVNVHGVFVGDESADSTRLKVSGYKGNILSCDNGVAVEYARYAANAAATIVMHNSVFSTGGTGVWGVAAVNKGNVSDSLVAVHELGHGLAGLGDEYIQRNEPFKDDPDSLRDTVNVTATQDPKLCKWHYWTPEEWPGLFGRLVRPKGTNVANFEGAGWVKGIYRPEQACIMRCDRDRFCVVCNETMEANFFRYIDLFAVSEPAAEDVVLWKGESVDFCLCAIDMLRQAPDWLKSRLNFYLDGRQVATSDRGELAFPFRGSMATPGVHQLGANLNVQSESVRRDFGFLSDNRSWRVTVLPHLRPGIIVKPRILVAPDGTVDEPVILRHATPSLFQLRMAEAPPGAVLEDGRFKWKPGGLTGSWRVDFTASLEQPHAEVTTAMEIHVKPAQDGPDSLEVQVPDPVDVVAGSQATIPLKADTKDAAHLLFEPVEVPAGVDINRNTGVVAWTPEMRHAGLQRLRFRVSNGRAAGEIDVLVRVRRAATPAPVSYCNTYIPQTLEALKQLQKCPLVYRRIFETLRLLRDRYPQVHQPALAEAKTMYEGLAPELRTNCLQELHLHAWEFSNKPEILQWLREIAGRAKPEIADLLDKRLDQIDHYNASRTA